MSKHSPNSPAPISVTLQDAVPMTGLSIATLYRRAQDGTLPLRKVGGRTLVLVKDLEALITGEAA